MLEGPAKGEKRKVDYKSIEVVLLSKRSFEVVLPSKKSFDGASSGRCAEASAQPQTASHSAPDAECIVMFGNLNMLD